MRQVAHETVREPQPTDEKTAPLRE